MLGGMFLRGTNNLLMPEMQTIKNTNRQGHGAGNGSELIKRVEDSHGCRCLTVDDHERNLRGC